MDKILQINSFFNFKKLGYDYLCRQTRGFSISQNVSLRELGQNDDGREKYATCKCSES